VVVVWLVVVLVIFGVLVGDEEMFEFGCGVM